MTDTDIPRSEVPEPGTWPEAPAPADQPDAPWKEHDLLCRRSVRTSWHSTTQHTWASYVPCTCGRLVVDPRVPVLRSDEVDPPLTAPQVERLQSFINEGITVDREIQAETPQYQYAWTGTTETIDEPEMLPHPGISDEFWALVSDVDREKFSAYLVREQAVHDIAVAMDIPEEVLTGGQPDVHEPGEDEGPIATQYVTTLGGWCVPSDNLYGLLGPISDITARRGGLSFSAPRPLTDFSKKELRAEVERLRRQRDELADSAGKFRTEARRLRRKNKRLLKIIGGLA